MSGYTMSSYAIVTFSCCDRFCCNDTLFLLFSFSILLVGYSCINNEEGGSTSWKEINLLSNHKDKN